jgi:hypothetical protein
MLQEVVFMHAQDTVEERIEKRELGADFVA